MTSSAQLGLGTTLTRAGHAIAEIVDINPPKPKVNMVDVTNHGSTSGWKEKLAGLIDGGTTTLKLNFIPGDTLGQMGLFTDLAARTLQAFVITSPPALGTSVSFSAFVTECYYDLPQDKQAMLNVTLEVSGVVTYAATASSNLTGLTISVGILSPAFVATQYEYDDVLTNGTASVTIVPTNAAAATILVNGTVVASGGTSGAILTPVGVTNITIITQDTSKTQVVYVIHASRTS